MVTKLRLAKHVQPICLTLTLAALFAPICAGDESQSASTKTVDSPARVNFTTESIRGKVGWLSDALHGIYGIKPVPESKERVLALRTANDDIFAIIEDLRGRAFRVDDRLRQMDVELMVRRYGKSGLIQIIKMFEIRDGGKYEVDYWCDICAIVMFEKGPCACCQDDNRLRKREVKD